MIPFGHVAAGADASNPGPRMSRGEHRLSLPLVFIAGIVLLATGGACNRDDVAARGGAALAGTATRAAAAEPSTDPPPPNLLVITIDTLRADHLGCYGYFRDTSPAIDRLAAESVLFERCYAPVAQTLPTHTSLFTGVYPYEHGVQSNLAKLSGSTWEASPKLKTLAAALGEAGYLTAGFVSAEPVKRVSGLAAGFQHWVEPDDKKVRADVTTKAFLQWCRAAPARPWFAWMHYFDCHAPYEPPPPYDRLYTNESRLAHFLDERGFAESAAKLTKNPNAESLVRRKDTVEDNNLYDGELRLIDDQLARVFDQLRREGLWGGLIVVLTADHGEALGQHGVQGHGGIWGEQLHVPLVIRVPGVAAGRSSRPTSSIDIVPTLAGLAPRVPLRTWLAQTSGVDVFSIPTRGIYTQTPRSARPQTLIRTSVMRDGWRFIRDDCDEDCLFDLTADPYELFNVIDRYPRVAAELRRELEDLVLEQQERGRENQAGGLKPVGRDHVRALQSLGYVDEDESDSEDDS